MKTIEFGNPEIRTVATFDFFFLELKKNYFISLLFSDALMPRFAERILNVTVTVGRDALLACVVDNLRGFKVSAIRKKKSWFH